MRAMTESLYTSALARSDCLYLQAELQDAIIRIAGEIDLALEGREAIFLTVPQGGMIFAGQLATSIRTPLRMDYIHATRYRSGTSGGQLTWIRRPALSLEGQQVILVDDILDEGYTLQAIRDDCLAQGAQRVWIAVLCEKQHGRRVTGLHADFMGVTVPDRYVFGYGMDYNEYGRNLPAIHALEDGNEG